ncbi:TPA: response regulator [Candidatus Poribacteria bacterium]|nr:response regulator [Candidatus Poribacteria bacterium]
MKKRPSTDNRLQARIQEVERDVNRAREQLQRRVEYACGALDVWRKVGVTGLKGQVLIVDGDPEFRREILEMVLNAGYRGDEAKDAVEATSYLQLAKYRLVIVDMYIQKGSGWRVMRRALRRFPGIKVVIIVRNNEQGRQAMRMGAFSFLVRPIDGEQLRTCVLSAMKLKHRACEVLLRGDPCDRSCVNHFLWEGDLGEEPEIEYVDTPLDDFDEALQK